MITITFNKCAQNSDRYWNNPQPGNRCSLSFFDCDNCLKDVIGCCQMLHSFLKKIDVDLCLCSGAIKYIYPSSDDESIADSGRFYRFYVLGKNECW